MDLNTLLKKTEAKSAKIKTTRLPPSIAVEDRPYVNDLQNETNAVNLNTTEPRTNLGQSSDKVRTNLGQSSDKLRTNLGQSSDKILESSDKLRTQSRTTPRTNLGQSSDKLRTKESFSTLVGLQRKITIFLYQCCQFVRDKITEPLTIEHIALSCETTILSAQKTIQRLEKKTIIIRAKFRTGRGGWTQYELNYDIFQELLHLETQDKLRTNLGQSSDKVRSQPMTQGRTTFPSSSSSYVLEDLKTTTTEPKNFEASTSSELPPDWQEVDYSGLEPIRFGKSHLLQWYSRKYCDSKAAQESIWHYAYFLKTAGTKKPDNPIAYIMSAMSRDKYFSQPDGYLSPEEESQKKRILQQRKEVEQRQEREQEFFELVFEEYFMNLSARKIKELSPMITNQAGVKGHIRNLYFEQHWLEIREAFQQGLSVHQFLFEPNEQAPAIRVEQPLEAQTENHRVATLKKKLVEFKKLYSVEPTPGLADQIYSCEQSLAEMSETNVTPEKVRSIADQQFGASKEIRDPVNHSLGAMSPREELR